VIARLSPILLATVACGGAAPAAAPTPPSVAACLADGLTEPLSMVDKVPGCDDTGDDCRAACHEGGDGVACVALAYDLEPDDATRDDAVALYRRGCELGAANACTNYGAHLLHGTGSLVADEACAARLHRRACDVGEPWGCGMVGRALAEGTGVEADLDRARHLLEGTCERLAGFPCWVLGQLREEGAFGAVDPAGALAAYQRACRTLDTACDAAERLAAGP
jgi:uncharacterized protein